jgi:hypothetical protein
VGGLCDNVGPEVDCRTESLDDVSIAFDSVSKSLGRTGKQMDSQLSRSRLTLSHSIAFSLSSLLLFRLSLSLSLSHLLCGSNLLF